jgi:hypothetical protein
VIEKGNISKNGQLNMLIEISNQQNPRLGNIFELKFQMKTRKGL